MDRDFINGIGELISWTFGILETLGNSFNWLIIAVMFVMMVIWIRMMATYNKKAKQEGTLK